MQRAKVVITRITQRHVAAVAAISVTLRKIEFSKMADCPEYDIHDAPRFWTPMFWLLLHREEGGGKPWKPCVTTLGRCHFAPDVWGGSSSVKDVRKPDGMFSKRDRWVQYIKVKLGTEPGDAEGLWQRWGCEFWQMAVGSNTSHSQGLPADVNQSN